VLERWEVKGRKGYPLFARVSGRMRKCPILHSHCRGHWFDPSIAHFDETPCSASGFIKVGDVARLVRCAWAVQTPRRPLASGSSRSVTFLDPCLACAASTSEGPKGGLWALGRWLISVGERNRFSVSWIAMGRAVTLLIDRELRTEFVSKIAACHSTHHVNIGRNER
jgi:hypothetical protein